MWMLLRWSTPPKSDPFDAPDRRRLIVVALFPKASKNANGNSSSSKGRSARAVTASSISTAFIAHCSPCRRYPTRPRNPHLRRPPATWTGTGPVPILARPSPLSPCGRFLAYSDGAISSCYRQPLPPPPRPLRLRHPLPRPQDVLESQRLLREPQPHPPASLRRRRRRRSC